MEFPPRVVFAFVVIAAFVGIAVWGVVAAARAKQLSRVQRGLGVTGIVLVMALLTAWVILVWPAYWD